MSNTHEQRRAAMAAYCARAGTDPLLVQGAGGNVSWKEGNTLWIKASGTWLADAQRRDIFVPVDLAHLQGELAAGVHEVKPRVKCDHALRPSIETILHALLPQTVVVHLHAVEILAHLVREDVETVLRHARVHEMAEYVTVDYHKPGVALAQAVQSALADRPDARVVFMRNHGVVVGGEDVGGVERLMDELVGRFRTAPHLAPRSLPPLLPIALDQGMVYEPLEDPLVHQLATEQELFARLPAQWALYPDHVVFLGPRASVHRSEAVFKTSFAGASAGLPELVFIEGSGVFARDSFTEAQKAQLRCYRDVLVRQPQGLAARALSHDQVAELLDWDAERYRMAISK